jgi:hypothetical protein
MKIHQRSSFYFLIILVLIVLDQFIFSFFFKLSYFEWYLKNGSLINIGAALVTFAWDVNKNAGLISANPRQYCGAYFQLIGAQLLAFGTSGKSNQRRQAEGESALLLLLDSLQFIIFGILIILLSVLWIIMIVPIQYFLILFLGGPGRIYSNSSIRLLGKFESTQLETKEIPWEEKKPNDWMDLSIANKPVTFTYALIALALTVVKFLI